MYLRSYPVEFYEEAHGITYLTKRNWMQACYNIIAKIGVFPTNTLQTWNTLKLSHGERNYIKIKAIIFEPLVTHTLIRWNKYTTRQKQYSHNFKFANTKRIQMTTPTNNTQYTHSMFQDRISSHQFWFCRML